MVLPPSRSAPFVGRAEELSALTDAFDASSSGQFVAVLVSGEAGVGKTRLVREFVTTLPPGTKTHWGWCIEDGGAPFSPWAQVLRSLTGTTRGVAQAAGVDRLAAFDAIATLLRSSAAEHQIVLVLDDLHVADLPSLELLRFLVRAANDAGVLLIGTHRDHELRADPKRDAILADVARFGRRLAAPRFNRSEVCALVEGIAGEAVPTAVVDAVLQRTAGNALFVDETARVLVSTGFEPLDVMPDGVRAAVRARLSALSPACREALDVASVLGGRTDRRVLAALLDVDPCDLADRLGPALALGVIADHGDGRLEFSHGLVRDAIHQDLNPRLRAAWHERAARTLLAVHAANLDPHVAAIAQHHADASLVGGEEPVAEWAARAAAVARAVHAHEEAATWSDRAARSYAALGRVDEQAEELARAADDLGAVANSDESIERGRQVTELARTTGSGELLARAARCRAVVFSPLRDPEAPALLREALAHRDNAAPSRRRAELLASLATLSGIPGTDGRAADADGARAACQELEALVTAGVDARDLVLEALLSTEHGPASFAARLDWLREYAQLDPTSDDRLSWLVKRTYWAASLDFESGRLGALTRDLDDWSHLAEVLGVRYWQWRVAVARASEAFSHGRLTEAEERAEASLALCGDLHRGMTSRVVTEIVFAVRHEQGRMAELVGSSPVERLGLGSMLVHIERGDVDSASSALVQQRAEAERSDRDIYWLCLMSYLARGAAFTGDGETCRWAVDQLLPFADQFVMFGRCYLFGGSVAELIGVAAAGAGRPELAERHLRVALSWAEHEDADGFATRTRLALAAVLGDRADGCRAERETLLRHVVELGSRLGMSALVARAQESLDGSPSPVPDHPTSRAGPVRGPAVRTFGAFSVTPVGADEPVRWTSKKARDTLKLLVARRGAVVLREELIEILWPGIELTTGRNRLSVVLTMVRSALDPDRRWPADEFLRADRDTVSLRTDRLDIDLDRFFDLSTRGLRGLAEGQAGAVCLLEDALALCHGGFLVEDAYADWPTAIRAEVATTYSSVLRSLADQAAQAGHHDTLVVRLSQLVDCDPYDERAHQALVSALAAAGRHGAAERQQAVHSARLADLERRDLG